MNITYYKAKSKWYDWLFDKVSGKPTPKTKLFVTTRRSANKKFGDIRIWSGTWHGAERKAKQLSNSTKIEGQIKVDGILLEELDENKKLITDFTSKQNVVL